MKCINPVLKAQIGNKTIFRHFDLASYIVKLRGIPFNCGKCLHCRKRKALELARRCVLHASMYQNNCFITLTYDESSVGDNTIDYSHIQKFKKRLRKSLNGKKIEIFNVHEYGSAGRKHWHLVIFNHDFEDKVLYSTSNNIPIYTSEKLRKIWPHGYNTVGSVSEASAMYQAQYTQKDIKNGNTNNSRKAKSNHSGIGKPYFLRHYKQFLTLGYIPFQGKKMPLPRYFEKLAHRHYCHFYESGAFSDLYVGKILVRKALYRPFKTGEENREIADLFIPYKENKQFHIDELALDWEEVIDKHIETKRPPDFVIAGENSLHEMTLKNQSKKEKF